MSYSIVIPSRTPENLAACVASIRACGEFGQVIIVWDRSRDNPPLEVIPNGCVYREVTEPFVFARNVNVGIRVAGGSDVILLNDDTRLLTFEGFKKLNCMAKTMDGYGVISAAITGAVGNPEQLQCSDKPVLRLARHHTLVFVAVYIRRDVLDKLGDHPDSEKRKQWLDEAFVHYGYDDDDVCERVRVRGYKLGVFDGCLVEHGVLPSSYRGAAGANAVALQPNRDIFIEKWGWPPGQRP